METETHPTSNLDENLKLIGMAQLMDVSTTAIALILTRVEILPMTRKTKMDKNVLTFIYLSYLMYNVIHESKESFLSMLVLELPHMLTRIEKNSTMICCHKKQTFLCW